MKYKAAFMKSCMIRKSRGTGSFAAVKQNGYALQYVKDQTTEICLEAVKQSGDALQYAKDRTTEICLEAVKQSGYALQYVKDQTTKNLFSSGRTDWLCLTICSRSDY